MVLLDTCTLLWWTLDPAKLSPAAADACRRIKSDGGCISAISIWEIGLKDKRGTYDLGMTLAEFAEGVAEIDGLEIVPVDTAIWIANIGLAWSHADPADRTIVATAQLRNIPIVTCDTMIQGFYPRTIW